MSSLDFEDKVLVGILAGTVALVALVNVWTAPDTGAAAVRIGRTFQVASASTEQPHYALRYTFPRLSKECLVDDIAAKDQARCEIELSRKPTEEVRLIAPQSSFALETGNTVTR